ncbi:PAQR family membrane homeostasis protein TrhA [Fictibacillus fluitans]|uniref:Hemolysin III family protein n=1 Tax=Fictibacillus fluitans TaxID=3058422 RepID=A0ABT8HST4_9BACL|nr:hemolysin III family protein [Fictibacillus sp. NE201]MDN4523837.1 hemolysin III family protein [Fictibacillus sp. NE201]
MEAFTYTKREEIINAVTHGIGAVFSIVALILLIVFASAQGTPLAIACFAIFGVTMLLLYTASTLVHSFPEGKLKDIFEIMDHSAIYLFIAGSYTPILLLVVKGALGWSLFGTVWGIALAGVAFKIFFTKRFVILSTIGYVLMGWMIIFAFNRVLLNLSQEGLAWLFAGGILYTVGAFFYVWRKFPYNHAVWHLFVLGGSVSHFVLMLYILKLS